MLALVLLSYLLLRTSKVQTYITSKFSDKLSTELKTIVSIDKVDVSWFFNIVVEGIYLEDLHGNPLLNAPKIEIDIDYLKVFDKRIHIDNVHLTEPQIAYRKYIGDTISNIQFILDYLKKEPKDTNETEPWQATVSGIELSSAMFEYDMQDAEKISDGFDHNHMKFTELTGRVEELFNVGDSLHAVITSMSGKDKSGFAIKHFTSEIIMANNEINLPQFDIETNYSKIHGDLTLSYADIKAWSKFITDIGIDIQFDSTYLSMKDIVYFSPSLNGMEDLLLLDGRLRGTIDKLRAKNFLVAYDLQNWFIGDVKIHGLPDVEQSFIMVNADELRVNPKTLATLELPGGKPMILPNEVNRLGKIKAEGRFTGFLDDFVANAEFNTVLGSLKTDLLLKPSGIKNKLSYEGSFSTKELNVGELLQTTRFGKITMDGNIKGMGLDQFTKAIVDVNIESLGINNGIYEDIQIDAKLDNRIIHFDLVSTDDRFLLDSEGDFNFGEKLPILNLHSNIENARIGRFLMNNQDTLGEISTELNLYLVGDALDNLKAEIKLDSTNYTYKTEHYYLEDVFLQTEILEKGRSVFLTSDYVDATATGIQDIYELQNDVEHILDKILPTLLTDTNNTESISAIEDPKNNLSITLNLKETKLLNELFLVNMELAPGTLLESTYIAEKDKMEFEVTAPYFTYDAYSFVKIHIDVEKEAQNSLANLTVGKLIVSDSVLIDSISIISSIEYDSINYHFHAGRKHNHNLQADFDGIINILKDQTFELSFQDAQFWLANTLFNIENGNKLWFNKTKIGAQNFNLHSKYSSIQANGEVNKEMSDSLAINFNNFSLDNFDPYTEDFYTNFDGILDGSLVLNNIYDYVDFLSEIEIENFKLNGTYLGQTNLNTLWNKERNAASLNLSIYNKENNLQPFNIYGYYYPQSETDNYDLFLNLSKFPANAVESYLSSFSSSLVGDISGKLNIKGKTASPEFSGILDMDIRKFKVDYLNTYYSFRDEMVFEPNKISFTNAKFYDEIHKKEDKNTALGDFELTHKDFKDIAIDLKITPTDMLLLNTSSRDSEMFYGRAFGKGDVHIYGPLTALNFIVDVKTSSGTKVSIPIIYSYNAEKADFITFVSPNAAIDSSKIKPVSMVNSEVEYTFNMDLMFRLKPEATIRIVMDETKNDVMEARGSGDIRITIDEDENVEMYGEYIIDNGSYGLYGKDFSIRQNSKIKWDGDIEEATLDIIAVHRVRANVTSLLSTGTDTNSTEKITTNVDCIISISGDLYSPIINFDIELPDLETTDQERISNMLSVGGEKSQDIINRNFVYLLFMKQFSLSQANQSSASSGAGTYLNASSAADILASQLGNIFNSLSEEIDIGVEWNSESNNTNEIVVVLRKSMLDGKLDVGTKVGTGSVEGEDGSRIVGDVDVEYKWNDNFRFRAYNKTNYESNLTRRADYTQGVGVTWRLKFDRFSFKRKEEVIELQDSSAVVVPPKNLIPANQNDTTSTPQPKVEVK